MKTQNQAAVVGTGPAGLISTYLLATHGVQVSLFEKRKGLGRKLLIAGSSGLNITYDAPISEFHRYYTVQPNTARLNTTHPHFERVFREFSPKAWIRFIENDLGIPTFKGTSRRYFVEGMKASALLKNWTEKLKSLGVKIYTDHEWTDFEVNPSAKITLRFGNQTSHSFDAVCLALGGGSYEPTEIPLRWVELLKSKNLRFSDFKASNVGFEVDWPLEFLKEAEGKPIKNVVLTSKKGRRSGELVVTQYGLEGTPIYFAGVSGEVLLDLKPDMDLKALLARLSSGKENFSPIRRIKKYLNLSQAAEALVYHLMPKEIQGDLSKVADYLKNFRIRLNRPRPLTEAISSSGGLSWEELNEDLMLHQYPGIFAAGEMLDWDAPTGGFLIQGSVSQGYFAAQGILKFLNRNSKPIHFR